MLFARAIFIFAVIATPPSATAQVEVRTPDGQPYVQAASGMSFPAAIRDFERERTYRYSPDGRDESVGYNRRAVGKDITATIYVYPSPRIDSSGQHGIEAARARLCRAQFDGVRQEIEGVYADEALVLDEQVSVTQANVTYSGHQAIYTLTPPIGARKDERLRSEVFLYCYVGGRWSVKLRFSYPLDYNARADIDAFLHDFAWTIPPETL